MQSPPRYRKGDKIGGNYLVHQALQGGMGEVYLCLDLQENYPYALKTFQQRYLANQRMRELFNHEVGIWVALEKHPNIVRCFKLETLDNQPFMLLQWIIGEESRGTSLREWLQRGPLDLRTTLDVTIDICKGLQHAGEKHPGIVHRDLKPDNVLMEPVKMSSDQFPTKRYEFGEDFETLVNLLPQYLEKPDELAKYLQRLHSSLSYKEMLKYFRESLVPGYMAKITDWGLAKLVRDAGLELHADEYTQSGMQSMVGASGVVGTPPYMAPEQWRGEEGDVRTDIYAIGGMLYEMLTGSMPYPATTMEGIRKKHYTASIPTLPGTFPRELNMLLANCLAKQPNERFATVDALLDVLSQVYQQEFSKKPPNTGGLWFNNQLTAKDHANRGTTYYQLGRYEEALVDYTSAIELIPTDEWAYLTRGLIYQELGRYEEALADFTYAIQLDPTNAIAYANRGTAYHELVV